MNLIAWKERVFERLGFAFHVPSAWSEEVEGSRMVLCGDDGEALLVSAYVVIGGSSEGRAEPVSKMVAAARASVSAAASASGLRIIHPLQPRPLASPFEGLFVSSLADAGVRLDQLIVTCPSGVVLMTFEAPHISQTHDVFEDIVGSIRFFPPTENGTTREQPH